MTKNDWLYYTRILGALVFMALAMLGIAWLGNATLWAFLAITIISSAVPPMISWALNRWTKISRDTVSWTEIGATQVLFTAGMAFFGWGAVAASLLILPVGLITSYIAPRFEPAQTVGEVGNKAKEMFTELMNSMPSKDLEGTIPA